MHHHHHRSCALPSIHWINKQVQSIHPFQDLDFEACSSCSDKQAKVRVSMLVFAESVVNVTHFVGVPDYMLKPKVIKMLRDDYGLDTGGFSVKFEKQVTQPAWLLSQYGNKLLHRLCAWFMSSIQDKPECWTFFSTPNLSFNLKLFLQIYKATGNSTTEFEREFLDDANEARGGWKILSRIRLALGLNWTS